MVDARPCEPEMMMPQTAAVPVCTLEGYKTPALVSAEGHRCNWSPAGMQDAVMVGWHHSPNPLIGKQDMPLWCQYKACDPYDDPGQFHTRIPIAHMPRRPSAYPYYVNVLDGELSLPGDFKEETGDLLRAHLREDTTFTARGDVGDARCIWDISRVLGISDACGNMRHATVFVPNAVFKQYVYANLRSDIPFEMDGLSEDPTGSLQRPLEISGLAHYSAMLSLGVANVIFSCLIPLEVNGRVFPFPMFLIRSGRCRLRVDGTGERVLPACLHHRALDEAPCGPCLWGDDAVANSNARAPDDTSGVLWFGVCAVAPADPESQSRLLAACNYIARMVEEFFVLTPSGSPEDEEAAAVPVSSDRCGFLARCHFRGLTTCSGAPGDPRTGIALAREAVHCKPIIAHGRAPGEPCHGIYSAAPYTVPLPELLDEGGTLIPTIKRMRQSILEQMVWRGPLTHLSDNLRLARSPSGYYAPIGELACLSGGGLNGEHPLMRVDTEAARWAVALVAERAARRMYRARTDPPPSPSRQAPGFEAEEGSVAMDTEDTRVAPSPRGDGPW
jgi:hypothetical protein